MRSLVWALLALLLFGHDAYSQTLTPGGRARPGNVGTMRVQNLVVGPSLDQTTALSGTYSGSIFPNVLQLNPDTAAVPGLNFVAGTSISDYFGGGNTQGGRIALQGVAVLTAPSNAASGFRDYVGGQFLAWAKSSDNGTNLTTSPAGNFFALSPYYILESGATNLGNASAIEANSIAKTGSSVKYKSIVSLVAGGALDTVQGSAWDVMLGMSAQTGSVGFQDAILIGSQNGIFPITSTGSIMRTFDASAVKDGINLLSLNITNCPLQFVVFSVCQSSMALGIGAAVQNGIINVVSNAAAYPTSNTTAFALSDNFSGGGREFDIWNTDILASPSFNFYQKTGASAANLEASLSTAGMTLGKGVPLIESGATSGTTTLQAPAVASGTLTLPAATDTLVGKATTDTFTNKTVTDEINQEFEVSTAAITYTSNTTLATVTGLLQALTAGKTYNCHGHLTVTAVNAAAGIKVAMVGTGSLTATSSSFVFVNHNGTTINAVTTETVLGTAAGFTGAVTDIFMDGAIVVNVAGTINFQAAQNVSNATGTTVGQNSTMNCVRVN